MHMCSSLKRDGTCTMLRRLSNSTGDAQASYRPRTANGFLTYGSDSRHALTHPGLCVLSMSLVAPIEAADWHSQVMPIHFAMCAAPAEHPVKGDARVSRSVRGSGLPWYTCTASELAYT